MNSNSQCVHCTLFDKEMHLSKFQSSRTLKTKQKKNNILNRTQLNRIVEYCEAFDKLNTSAGR